MVEELDGNIIWRTAEAFQKDILPKPPQSVMSHVQIAVLTKKFNEMLAGYNGHAATNKMKQEDQLVTGFAEIVNNHIFALPHCPVTLLDTVPGYVMRLSLHMADQVDEGLNKADAGIFRDDVQLEEDRPNWVHQRGFAEFKRKQPKKNNDPFDDTPDADVEPKFEGRAKVRGQKLAYADRVFVFQHRSAVYSFLIIEDEFRFFRWDRSGVFVTNKLSYVQHTRTFVELMLGLTNLDDASQGIDTTATLLDKSSDDYKHMDRIVLPDSSVLTVPVLSHEEGTALPSNIPCMAIPVSPGLKNASETLSPGINDPSTALPDRPSLTPTQGAQSEEDPRCLAPKDSSFVFTHALDYFKGSVEDGWPRYRLSVGAEIFLVGRPIFETSGLIGRGTRGYPEGDILKKLNDAGVENVPTLVCHSHIGNHATAASDFQVHVDQRSNAQRKAAPTQPPVSPDTKSTKGKGEKRKREEPARHDVRHYVHYRMVTKEICLPLVVFGSSRRLIQLLSDVLDAHASAVDKCKLIHRDISSGNILILPVFVKKPGETGLRVVWKGILCDWEVSKPIAESKAKEKARQPQRTGTWKYMPIASLLDMFHIVGIPDEMESIFNVALYNTIRYTPHNLQERIHTWIQKYFVEWEDIHGVRQADIVFGGDEDMALNNVFHTMLTWFGARYKIMLYEQQSSKDRDKTPGQTKDGHAPLQRKKFFIPRPKGNPVEKPTKEDYEFASSIATHDDVKALFRYALSKQRWPESEKWQDHLAIYPAPELAKPLASHLSLDVTTSGGFWHSPDTTADLGVTGTSGPAAKSAKLRLPPKSAADGRRVKTAKNIQLAFARSGPFACT
ncbi:hypothetical protein C8Q74DRAFT_1447525 [Fomes fomentarius]|nr:hypothetical protein C8Q74DRAFT_1447525 [Fomes fomentarius]